MGTWLYNILILCFFEFSQQQSVNFNYKKLALPQVYERNVKEYIVSNNNKKLPKCYTHLLRYVDILVNSNGSANWAKQMFDSGTKFPSGILNGNSVDYGTFDQCLEIKTKFNNDFMHGKYCLGSINPYGDALSHPRGHMFLRNFGLKFATCLPDSCSTEEIQDMYNHLNLSAFKVEFSEDFCQSMPKQATLSAADIVVIIFLGTVVVLMILSTVYDIILFYLDKSNIADLPHIALLKKVILEPIHTLLVAFSVLSNGRKLLRVSKSSNHISCLHGLRAISIMWIILAQRYFRTKGHPYQNSPDLVKWSSEQASLYIAAATLTVDTFLLLSGLIIGYSFLAKTNFIIYSHYIHRYLRFTPVVIVVMLLYLTLFKHLGSGPWWFHNAQLLKKPCEEGWWSVLLYVQNYVTINHCVEQSWYLAVDTQLYFIAPLILIPLQRRPKIGYLILATLTFLTILASFITSWIFKFHGLITKNYGVNYYRYYYTATHTRASPWLIGLALGYYIYKVKTNTLKVILNKIVVAVLWTLSFTILATCVVAGHVVMTLKYDRLVSAFYIALLSPGWAVGLGILIYLCTFGYGGPINWFLSLPVFQVLSKFTYSMYLTYVAMQAFIFAQDRVVPYMRDVNMMHAFWGDYMFTLGVSVLMTLAFESPILAIQKFLSDRNKQHSSARKSEKSDSTADFNEI